MLLELAPFLAPFGPLGRHRAAVAAGMVKARRHFVPALAVLLHLPAGEDDGILSHVRLHLRQHNPRVRTGKRLDLHQSSPTAPTPWSRVSGGISA